MGEPVGVTSAKPPRALLEQTNRVGPRSRERSRVIEILDDLRHDLDATPRLEPLVEPSRLRPEWLPQVWFDLRHREAQLFEMPDLEVERVRDLGDPVKGRTRKAKLPPTDRRVVDLRDPATTKQIRELAVSLAGTKMP